MEYPLRSKRFSGIVVLLVMAIAYLITYYFVTNHKEKKVVEIYFADRITAAHRILIDKYNAMHQGKIRVVPVDFPNYDFSTNERKEVLARLLRGRGDGIDLFAVDVIWVRRFAKWSEPLDSYFSEEEKKRILPHALKSCYADSSLVAVPLDLVQGVLYYREDILKKLQAQHAINCDLSTPMKWSEFLKLNEKFGNYSPFYIFPAADYEGLLCEYIELLLSIEPDYFEKNGFNLNTPSSQKALQFLVDLIHRHGATPVQVTKFTEIPSYEYFIKNNGLFIHGWQSYDKDFKEMPFDAEKEKYIRKAPLPYLDGGIPASLFGGWNLMLSKFSDKKNEVVDFVKFLLSDEAQETFYQASGYYPVVKSFYEDPQFKSKYPEILTIRQYLNSGVHRPSHPDYTRYSKIISYYFHKAVKNEMTVAEALQKATSSIAADNYPHPMN